MPYPVKLRLKSPMQVMYALDRLSTMLIEGAEVSGFDWWKECDGKRYRQYHTHPMVLRTLISQILVQCPKPRMLNEFAYRILYTQRRLERSLNLNPWSEVTVGGYRDALALAYHLQNPVMRRSYDTLQEYILERRTVGLLSGLVSPEEPDELLGLRKV